MSYIVRELKWISNLFKDFGVFISLPIVIHCDNLATLHTMKNPVFHECTEYLEIVCHIVRGQHVAGFVAPVHVCSLL